MPVSMVAHIASLAGRQYGPGAKQVFVPLRRVRCRLNIEIIPTATIGSGMTLQDGLHRLVLILLLGGIAAIPANARSVDEIIDADVLRVGVSLFTPWTMEGPDGDLSGFEVDVARKLAEDLGVKADLQVFEWDKLIPALEAGRIDIIAAGMAITPERALRVYFSDPYAEGGITLATNTANTVDVETLDDLNAPRYRLAAVKGTVSEELARRLFDRAKLSLFDEHAEAAEALINGDIDAYLEGAPGPQFLALENPERIDIPLARPLLPTRSAFAVARGSTDLIFYLNAWITAREADTWLPSTQTYWFNSLRWREQVEE